MCCARSAPTRPVVNGRRLQRGEEVPALPGSQVLLSGVMALALLGRLHAGELSGDDATRVAC